MRAVTIPSPGEPDALVLAEVDDPVPGPGEVLVDVVATAVNRADVLQRRGFYDPPPGASRYPGLECAGRVAALGEGVAGWAVGDEVCALLAGGGYAEKVAVPSGQLLPVPAGLSLLEAAALPEVVCTVWSNVFGLAALEPGEVLLVHGGTSGIGTCALQLASRHGARVFCTVGSAAKAERAVALGAERAVLYREEDFVDVVRTATDGKGADVVLDNMGAQYLERNVKVLATGGRLVVIGLQGGTRAELDLGRLLAKRASVHATALRARPTADKAAIVESVLAGVWPAVEAGEVRPVVDRVLPLEQVAEAHRVVEASEHVGKVVLQVRDA
ncbi:MAG TPA: NAD(P)H-quinone oxidoreductase [Mycobacteriales bacterium]|nr:NAD(P)H-quinone oxidoreductase [Mycobacteriales bacterium]